MATRDETARQPEEGDRKPPRVPLGPLKLPTDEELRAETDYAHNEALRAEVEADTRAWANQAPPDVEYEVDGEIRVLKGVTALALMNAQHHGTQALSGDS